MNWQFYWKRWHFGIEDRKSDEGFSHRFVFFGPLQMYWYRKRKFDYWKRLSK